MYLEFNINNNRYSERLTHTGRLHILYVIYLEFNYCLKIIIIATLTGPKRLHILYVMYLEFNYCLKIIIIITIIATLTGLSAYTFFM